MLRQLVICFALIFTTPSYSSLLSYTSKTKQKTELLVEAHFTQQQAKSILRVNPCRKLKFKQLKNITDRILHDEQQDIKNKRITNEYTYAQRFSKLVLYARILYKIES